MHAPTIRCRVVEVPVESDIPAVRREHPPRDLLPWADPYIALLLAKHGAQVWQAQRPTAEECRRRLRGEQAFPLGVWLSEPYDANEAPAADDDLDLPPTRR